MDRNTFEMRLDVIEEQGMGWAASLWRAWPDGQWEWMGAIATKRTLGEILHLAHHMMAETRGESWDSDGVPSSAD